MDFVAFRSFFVECLNSGEAVNFVMYEYKALVELIILSPTKILALSLSVYAA